MNPNVPSLPRRVEFIAPSGMGKSTLYREIARSRSAPSPWLTEEEAFRRAARRAQREEPCLKWPHRLALRVPLLSGMAARRVQDALGGRAFGEFAGEHEAFLAAAAGGFCLPGRTEHRRSEGWFLFVLALKRYAFVSRWAGGAPLVCDESLGQRVSAVMPCVEEPVRRYFERMPAVQGVIHLDAPEEIAIRNITRRLRDTGRIHSYHRGLSERELRGLIREDRRMMEVGASTMESRGIPVLRLDAAADPAVNLELSRRFLGTVFRDG